MAKILPLYSGSSGNCTAIINNKGALLVDMGGSCKKTLTALYEHSLSAADLGGILITHEHSDHIGGLAVFLKHYNVPLYGSAKTLEAVSRLIALPAHTRLIELPAGELELCGMGVRGFSTPHDSVDCHGYRFSSEGGNAAVATDIGHVTGEAFEALSGCRAVALESNYDEGMLAFGKYPQFLKQRIRSDFGHLSNLDCADTVKRLVLGGTTAVRLMHISTENNSPSMALTTCLSVLEAMGADDVDIKPANRYTSTEPIYF